MSCEFCPKNGGGCIVCDPIETPPGESPPGWGSLGDVRFTAADAAGILTDDPPFTASIHYPAASRLRGRPVPVTVFVAWEWWGVEVAGPAADCLEFLAGREVPPSARPAFCQRLRRKGGGL